MANTKLTLKNLRFCEEYLIDLNAAQAAIRCGYSKKTAKEQGARLLTDANIQAEIKRLMQERSKSTQVTAQMVVEELSKVGFANIQDYIKKGFKIEMISELKKEHAAAIESVQIETKTQNGLTITKAKIKLHSKTSALDMLGKHFGIFKEDNSQSATKIIIEGG